MITDKIRESIRDYSFEAHCPKIRIYQKNGIVYKTNHPDDAWRPPILATRQKLMRSIKIFILATIPSTTLKYGINSDQSIFRSELTR